MYNNIDFKDLRILIVDDSNSSSTLIRQQVHSLGTPYDNIEICSSYQETIKLFNQSFYDILIVDYHLEQCIDGNQLVGLLRKKKLLNHKTGIIVISGDSSLETVLTVLSSNVLYFLKKPLKTDTLGVKIRNVQKDQNLVVKAKKIVVNKTINSFEKVDKLKLITDSSSSLILIESKIFEMIEEEQEWDLLSLMIQCSTTTMHMSKVSATASILHQEGLFIEATQLLEDFLISNPLAYQVLDKLVYSYEKKDMPYDALRVAIRAFDCTPSIHERMLTVAKLSVQVHNTQALMNLGRKFAHNLSIIDISWMSGVIRYSDKVLEQLRKHPSLTERKQLISCMIEIFKIFNHKITNSQQPFLICYKELFLSHLCLIKKQQSKAHYHLFKAIRPHYNSLDKLPSSLIIEIVKIADVFGEIWLSEYLLNILSLRNVNDLSTQKELDNIVSDNIRNEKGMYLKQRLQSAHEFCYLDDMRSYTIYKSILDIYPFCIEAQVGMVKAATIISHNYECKQLRKLIINDYLPFNWLSWLEDIKREDVIRPFPSAL